MVFAAGLYLTVLSTNEKPKWFSELLAGYALDNDESHREVGVHDATSGYYITRYSECDGAILVLKLTKDRHLIEGAGYNVPGFSKDASGKPLAERKFSNLKANPNVAIGDTMASVREHLGKPKRTELTGKRKQFTTLRYEWLTKEREGKVSYIQEYTFKANKLIEVEFCRSLGD